MARDLRTLFCVVASRPYDNNDLYSCVYTRTTCTDGES